MHSLAPYSARIYNPNIKGVKPAEKFCKLGNFGGFDLFILLKSFIKSKSTTFHLIDKSKLVYRFEKIKIDATNRTVSGWFQLGTYGTKHDIINVNTGAVDYQKTKEHAEIVNHYIHLDIPKDCDEGVVLLHMFRGNGIKTVFFELFGTYIESKTNFKFRMNPLSYKSAFKKWEDAVAKEIRLIEFNIPTDIADKVKGLGHKESIMIMRAPKKGTLGKLKDYLNKKSEQAKVIELLTPLCEQVKTVVELNGRKRVFSVGVKASNAICEIEAPSTLKCDDDGLPSTAGMSKWCKEVASEFKTTLYGRS